MSENQACGWAEQKKADTVLYNSTFTLIFKFVSDFSKHWFLWCWAEKWYYLKLVYLDPSSQPSPEQLRKTGGSVSVSLVNKKDELCYQYHHTNRHYFRSLILMWKILLTEIKLGPIRVCEFFVRTVALLFVKTTCWNLLPFLGRNSAEPKRATLEWRWIFLFFHFPVQTKRSVNSSFISLYSSHLHLCKQACSVTVCFSTQGTAMCIWGNMFCTFMDPRAIFVLTGHMCATISADRRLIMKVWVCWLVCPVVMFRNAACHVISEPLFTSGGLF